jgi:hypothetical protein
MDNQYSIFRKFSTLNQAKDMQMFLNENEIETILADNAPPVDITFTGNTSQSEFEIRIKQSDFEKALNILEKGAENLIDEVERDYYLFDFANEELYDVLLKADEWNEFDYVLSQKILTERGEDINEALLKSLKQQRITDLAKPEGGQNVWIIAGYIFSFVAGFFGLIIGYFLWTQKKTLPDGQRIFCYKESDRKHGKYIFYIGLIVFPITLIWKIYNLK